MDPSDMPSQPVYRVWWIYLKLWIWLRKNFINSFCPKNLQVARRANWYRCDSAQCACNCIRITLGEIAFRQGPLVLHISYTIQYIIQAYKQYTISSFFGPRCCSPFQLDLFLKYVLHIWKLQQQLSSVGRRYEFINSF